MKHFILFAIIITVALVASNAQNARFGFAAGPVFANYHSKVAGESDNGNSKTGISVGVLVDIPAGKNFTFQPAVNFVQKGTQDKETSGGVTEKVKLTANCIEVPLNFLYNTTGNTGTFFIGAGPSFAFAISGKWKFDDGTDSFSEDVKFGNDPDNDDLKGLDIGANILAGYRFPNGLFFSAGYNAGLNNLYPGSSDIGTLKSNYFGVKIGFMLNAAKSKK